MDGHLFCPQHLLLFLYFSLTAASLHVQEQIPITAPPSTQRTSCPNGNVLKRQESCEFGKCGASCLSQGAFCCGPAGTLVTSPYWVCDNGACITSVRGTTGIVDCYDPDNPAGTTQSCIDNVPTATCKPTDRCYTCLPAQPFCRWETYIAERAPTLSWFSCVETKLPDTTFYAASITADISSPGPSSGAVSGSPQPHNSNTGSDELLPTGAIIGIAVGATLVVGAMVGLLVYCCFKKRKPKPKPTQELSGKPMTPSMTYQPPTELDGQLYARSELNSNTTYSPHSQPISPFTAGDGYREDLGETWPSGQAHAPSEPPPPNRGFITETARELPSQSAEERRSWKCGDDQFRMSPLSPMRPTTRF